MIFRDEANIEVIAGKGGDGIVSFRRELYAPRGGPDGGDGGDGGSVILVASDQVNSLLGVARSPRYIARGGGPGGPRNCSGKGAPDIVIEVPIGTQVRDAAHMNLMGDLDSLGAQLVVARGGRGGKGNQRFANSIRQVPRFATHGQEGERRKLALELKLFAEVGLLGFPNAGKSTFLSRVTAARPKIADYPFTTLDPQVGIAALDDYATLVIADLPGLIEGAAEGVGLGHKFLKHVERCRVLLHLVDLSDGAERDPVVAWRALEEELRRANAELYAKPRIVVATKCFEDDGWEERIAPLRAAVDQPVLPISSVMGVGLPELLRAAAALCRT